MPELDYEGPNPDDFTAAPHIEPEIIWTERDQQRDLDGGHKPLASETALGILRAKLTDGDLDGLYIKLNGIWVKAEDAFDHCFVMRGGEWVKADNPDIERWLLSITNGG